jgi:hypothetical protein
MPARKPLRKPAAESQRPQPDWDVVASQLGIAPPEEPAEAAPALAADTPSEFSEALTEVFPTADDLLSEPGEIGGISTVVVEERGLVEESRPAMAEATEKKSLRRRRKRRRRDRLPREAEARESGVETETAEQLISAETDEARQPFAERTLGAAEQEQEQPRPKHRRQRRSSRRRREPPTSGEGVPAERPEISLEEPPLASDEELLEDADAAAEQQREAGEQEPPTRPREAAEERVGHRAIPTWEEAIGVIIAANLEARAKRPGGGAPRGRNGNRNAKDRRGSARKPGGQGE